MRLLVLFLLRAGLPHAITSFHPDTNFTSAAHPSTKRSETAIHTNAPNARSSSSSFPSSTSSSPSSPSHALIYRHLGVRAPPGPPSGAATTQPDDSELHAQTDPGGPSGPGFAEWAVGAGPERAVAAGPAPLRYTARPIRVGGPAGRPAAPD